LRDHPEFSFAVVKYWTLDDLPFMGSPNSERRRKKKESL
jgi:hypothetical protein